MISKKSKIFVAGHNGMIGSAVVRKLKELKYKNIHTIDRNKLDLREQNKVYKYLNRIYIEEIPALPTQEMQPPSQPDDKSYESNVIAQLIHNHRAK